MVNLFVNSEEIAVKRVVLATVMSAALLCVWGASAKAGSLTPQKAFDEMQAHCQQYGQDYEKAAKLRNAGMPLERFLKQMMDDNTVTPERYKGLAEIVVYVYGHPTLPPDFLRKGMERGCVQEFIKKLR